MMELSRQDHKLLAQKLGRLTQTADAFSAGGYLIQAKGRNPRLEAILSEIDDSMLSETLTFSEGSAVLDVYVSGRRLIGVTRAEGLEVADEFIGKAVSPEDDSHMTAIQSVMTALAGMDGDLHLTVGSKANLGDGATIGVSTAQLRRAWGLVVDLPELEGDSALEKLLNGLGDSVVAHLDVHAGSVKTSDGPDDHTTMLQSVLEDQLMSFDEWRETHANGHGDPSLTCVLGAGPDDTALILMKDGDDMGLMTVKADKALFAHALWRQIQSA